MTKKMVLDTLNSLPDDFDLEELLRRLILIDKVEKAGDQADQGMGTSLEEVEERFQRKWDIQK